MGRVTDSRRKEIQKFVDRWEPIGKSTQTIKIDGMVLAVAIKIIKELLDE